MAQDDRSGRLAGQGDIQLPVVADGGAGYGHQKESQVIADHEH
jgi:hypothetical protein